MGSWYSFGTSRYFCGEFESLSLARGNLETTVRGFQVVRRMREYVVLGLSGPYSSALSALRPISVCALAHDRRSSHAQLLAASSRSCYCIGDQHLPKGYASLTPLSVTSPCSLSSDAYHSDNETRQAFLISRASYP